MTIENIKSCEKMLNLPFNNNENDNNDISVKDIEPIIDQIVETIIQPVEIIQNETNVFKFLTKYF